MAWIPLPKKKWKRALLLVPCVGITLVALDLALVQYWLHVTISTATTGLDHPLNASGTPDYVTALNQHFGEGVTPDDNALVPLLKVLGTDYFTPKQRDKLFELGLAGSSTASPQYIRFDQWAQQLPPAQRPSSKDIDDQDTKMGQLPWRRQDKPLWWQWLGAEQQALADVRLAVRKPRLYVPWAPAQDHVHGLIGDPLDAESPLSSAMPVLTGGRMLATILRADAFHCAGESDWPHYREDILAMCRLSRLINQGPTLIAVLVAVAIDAMASSTVRDTLAAGAMPADQANVLLSELNKLEPVGSTARAFDTAERWLELDDCAYAAQIGFAGWHAKQLKIKDFAGTFGSADPSPGVSWQIAAWTIPVNFNRSMREVNTIYDRLTAAASLPTYQDRFNALTQITHQYSLPDPSASDLLTRPTRVLLGDMDTLPKCLILAQRSQAQHDMALIMLALNIFHDSHHAYPLALDDLKNQNILSPFPIDGFTDKPYNYHLAGDGYVLFTPGDENKSEGDRTLERWGVFRVPKK